MSKKLSEYPTARCGGGIGNWLMSDEADKLCDGNLHVVIPAPVADAADAVMQAADAQLQMYDDCADDDVGDMSKGDLGYFQKLRDALARLEQVRGE